MHEDLLLHPFLHLICEGPEMDSVSAGDQVEGVASHASEAEACGEGEAHHKRELEVV